MAPEQVEMPHHSRVEEHVGVRIRDVCEAGLLRQLLGQEYGRSRSHERGNRYPRRHRDVQTHLQASDVEAVPRLPALGPVDEVAPPTRSEPNPGIQVLTWQE